MNYRGFEIRLASPTGGKAGRGFNKTSHVRAIRFDKDKVVHKIFRFDVDDPQGALKATANARAFVDGFLAGEPVSGT